jgi:hypothetical protein
MSKGGDDPFGDQDTDAIAKKHLEELLVKAIPKRQASCKARSRNSRKSLPP